MNCTKLFGFCIVVIFFSCNKPGKWSYENNIDLGKIGATGLVKTAEGFWLSDTDHNQMVRIDMTGKILETVEGFERPMHIANTANGLLIPQYTSDTVTLLKDGKQTGVQLPRPMDAPAGADMDADQLAIADFYNHQVQYTVNGVDKSFGKKGEGPGEFHYPTDVQIYKDKLYVADAYNHRGQVFDTDGTHLMTFGLGEVMNAMTGIFVNEELIVVTDFENDRVISYNHDGKMIGIIEEQIEKPSDIVIDNGKLYVLNYRKKTIAVFK